MTILPESMRKNITDAQWELAKNSWRDANPDLADNDWEIQSIALLIKMIQIKEANWWLSNINWYSKYDEVKEHMQDLGGCVHENTLTHGGSLQICTKCLLLRRIQ